MSDDVARFRESSEYREFIDPVDGTQWLIDVEFLASGWTCIWDQGCPGIEREPAPELGRGCCSVGAEVLDADEALRIGALGLALDPDRFEHHATAEAGGVFSDASRSNTRVVDGACIFLNRPGFAGGAGCALHLGALDDGDDPIDWKPAICWQAPLRVDVEAGGTRVLRPWTPDDWHGGRADMAWCCTDREQAPETATAYISDTPVAERLHSELRALLGPEIAVELRPRQ